MKRLILVSLILMGLALGTAQLPWAQDAKAAKGAGSAEGKSEDKADHKKDAVAAAPESSVAPAAEPSQAETVYPDGEGVCLADASVLGDLKAQRQALRVRADELKKRQDDLEARERALSEQMAKLEELRKAFVVQDEARLAKNEEQVGKLLAAIEKMSPKNASAMFSGIDEGLAVLALTRLSTEKAAKIMGGLEPQKSARLAELMALGRTTSKGSDRGLAGEGGKRP
jgi:flagellar motility protein MotE (MotC chaperone)